LHISKFWLSPAPSSSTVAAVKPRIVCLGDPEILAIEQNVVAVVATAAVAIFGVICSLLSSQLLVMVMVSNVNVLNNQIHPLRFWSEANSRSRMYCSVHSSSHSMVLLAAGLWLTYCWLMLARQWIRTLCSAQLSLILDSCLFSSSKPSMLNCYCFNAQSIVNKTSELYDMLYHTLPDCVLASESWLKADICDGLLDPKCIYKVFCKDRVGRRGGGVCAFVNRNHPVLPCRINILT